MKGNFNEISVQERGYRAWTNARFAEQNKSSLNQRLYQDTLSSCSLIGIGAIALLGVTVFTGGSMIYVGQTFPFSPVLNVALTSGGAVMIAMGVGASAYLAKETHKMLKEEKLER